MNPPDMKRAALAFARRGIPVFPIHTPVGDGCSCGTAHKPKENGKHPRTRRGLTDASADLGVVSRWWTDAPDANIAIATGERAGVWLLDVDQGTEAETWIAEMQEANGALPTTRTALSGGGGWHWFWRMDEHVAAWLAFHDLDLPTRNGIGGVKGRDVRANGGYVIAPPSLHRSGRRYEWAADVPSVYAPEWLLLEVARPVELARPYVAPPIIPGDAPERRWGLAVLRKRCAVILASSGDQRHDTIRASARVVGGVVGSGYVGRDEAEDALVSAGVAVGRGVREVRRVVRWGLDKGEGMPIVMPVRS